MAAEKQYEGLDLVGENKVIKGTVYSYPDRKQILINMNTATTKNEIKSIIDVYRALTNSYDTQMVRLLCQFGHHDDDVAMADGWVRMFAPEFLMRFSPEYMAIVLSKDTITNEYFSFAPNTVVEVFTSITRADVKMSRLLHAGLV